MRKFGLTLLGAASGLAVAAGFVCVAPQPAHAHDYAGDMFCAIRDQQGNALFYVFGGNTSNADGSPGGTVVETGFMRNGVKTVAPVGARPIWMTTVNKANGLLLVSRDAPEWRIGTGSVAVIDGQLVAEATLFHNNRVAGVGSCKRQNAMTAGAIGDQGQ